MPLADDVLYKPVSLDSNLPAWRKLARDLTEYINTIGEQYKPMFTTYSLNRDRPVGSLTIEELLGLHHEHNHTRFFIVTAGKHTTTLETLIFTGQIELLRYEDGHAPRLAGTQYSIRDLNLVANVYTRHYVFAHETDARTYMKSI